MALDPAAPVWTVVDYDSHVLAHRVDLAEALRVVLEMLAAINDWEGDTRHWPLFMVAPKPLGGAGWEPIAGGLHRINSPDDRLRARGITVDLRDLVAAVPALDVHGAADDIYAPFRNVDLCSGAYRDMPLLFEWPQDRVNHMEELDALLERHVCERYAVELAAGTPVTITLERTRLTHLDELHLWVFQQLFNFHAAAPGRYTAPDQTYGFDASWFGPHVVLAWGCMPHAHEMAWGIAWGIDVDLPIEADTEAPSRRRKLEMRLEPRFVAQVDALLQARPADWTPMSADDVTSMLEEKEVNRRSQEERAAASRAADRRLAAKRKAAKQRAAKRKATRKTAKTAAKKTTNKPAKKTTNKPAKKTTNKPVKKTTKKTSTKKTVKKTAAKKTAKKPAKKTSTKKTVKKTAATKTTKKPVKKTAANKATTKPAATKTTKKPVKKTAAKKTTKMPVKKTAATKATTKPVKKTAATKATRKPAASKAPTKTATKKPAA